MPNDVEKKKKMLQTIAIYSINDSQAFQRVILQIKEVSQRYISNKYKDMLKTVTDEWNMWQKIAAI